MEVQRRKMLGAGLAKRIILFLVASILAMFTKEVGKWTGMIGVLSFIEEVFVTFGCLIIAYILLWFATGGE